MTRDDLLRAAKQAAEQVASWPEWKRELSYPQVPSSPLIAAKSERLGEREG